MSRKTHRAVSGTRQGARITRRARAGWFRFAGLVLFFVLCLAILTNFRRERSPTSPPGQFPPNGALAAGNPTQPVEATPPLQHLNGDSATSPAGSLTPSATAFAAGPTKSAVAPLAMSVTPDSAQLPGAAPLFVSGQILVRPKPGLSDEALTKRLENHGARSRHALGHVNVRVIQVPEDRAEALLTALRNDAAIEFAERDGIARAAFVPNDTYVLSGQEWHLARIQAPQAWNLTTGRPNTVVAVLDSGINAAHPDLAGRTLPGYDFVNGDNDPADDFGHGTAVAGVVVAAGNNAVGVAGVAYGCSVLPIKVVDASGWAAYSAIAQGINYAVANGARVINLSLAGSQDSDTLQAAVNYAWNNNVVVVAAAGNNGNNSPQYPAACEHVVAVAATEPDDSLASFSSYGSFLTLAAPGDNIWTTQRDLSNPYGSWRGTSFASPMVAGVAALLLSARPSLANTQIVALLEQGADDLGPAGYDTTFGYGRANAFRALNAAKPEPPQGFRPW